MIIELPSKMKIMKVLYKLDNLNGLNRPASLPNHYEVMVMGAKEIESFYDGYDNRLPEPVVEVVANLVGKIKVDKNNKEYNNLTLIHKSAKFIYERNQESN